MDNRKAQLPLYTFLERCEELDDLYLEDGTKKIFCNMKSKNGRDELVSLLQYMKNTTLENPEVTLKDYRIVMLDEIVSEVKQSVEWEAARVSIYEIGLENGRKEGRLEGREEGRLEGILQMLFQLVQEGILSIADGAARARLTEDEFVEKMNAAEKAKNRQR